MRQTGQDMSGDRRPDAVVEDDALESPADLREHVKTLELRLRKRDEQRRAMLHMMADLNEINKRLGDQRKAMIHILGDYEKDRSLLAWKRARLDKSRRALLHILQDSPGPTCAWRTAAKP